MTDNSRGPQRQAPGPAPCPTTDRIVPPPMPMYMGPPPGLRPRQRSIWLIAVIGAVAAAGIALLVASRLL